MARENKDGGWTGEKRKSPFWERMTAEAETQGTGSWDWRALQPTDLIATVMNEANKHGDAISFATNKAHTAGSVTVLHSGLRPRRWVNSYDEAEAFLGDLLAEYEATPLD